MKNSYLFYKLVISRIGNIIAVKSGQLGGNADIFMLILSADILDFLVTYIFLEKETIHFFLVT